LQEELCGGEGCRTEILAIGNCPMNLENVTYIGHGAGALAGDGDRLDPVAAEVETLAFSPAIWSV
jgi:hypothetical protein